MARPRSLSGIKPSGTPHLGNLLGMIRPAIELQEDHDAFYFIADLHALTTVRDRQLLREHTLEIAATFLALGLDPARAVFWRQSDVPEVCELSWILSCVTSMGMLERAHAWKAAKDRGDEGAEPHGLFAYPVLMAADILLYDADVVPVGKDQVQHVEMCRDMAGRFNDLFGTALVLPKAHVRTEVHTVPGTDGRKMSKSYHNTIPIFLPPKSMKKALMAVTTDSKTLEEPKDPETCNVFALYKLFAPADAQADLALRYRAGNFGYGHAKAALVQAVETTLGPARDRYEQLRRDEDTLEDVLHAGAARARSVAGAVIDRVRTQAGIGARRAKR